MILGVGIDLVDVPAFTRQLEEPFSAFVDCTFTQREQSDADAQPHRLAARYAAKEALIKAWSGSRNGYPPALPHVDLREIEVVLDNYGRPSLQLHGEVRAHVPGIPHVSLSHDGATATAVVVLDQL